MTLLLGLPAILWQMSVLPPDKAEKSKKKKANEQVHKINRLSLLLDLTAALFFTGVVCALASDGTLTFTDGIVMIGLLPFLASFPCL